MHKIVAIIANSALYLLFLSLISPFRFILMLFFPPPTKVPSKKWKNEEKDSERILNSFTSL